MSIFCELKYLQVHHFVFFPFFFFFNDTATTEIYTLSLHDALPISRPGPPAPSGGAPGAGGPGRARQGPCLGSRDVYARKAPPSTSPSSPSPSGLRRPRRVGVGGLGVGPLLIIEMAPGGARSGCHSHVETQIPQVTATPGSALTQQRP